MKIISKKKMDPQAMEIEEARGRKNIVAAIIAEGERNPNFYSQWDVAICKDKGIIFKRGETLPQGHEFTHLIPGDHVYYRGAFGIEMAEHHGIYVGAGWIVEAWVNTSQEGYYRALVTPEIRAGMVDARTLDEFTDRGSKVVFIRDYIPERTAAERHDAVHRAIDSFGTRGYNLMRSNCEHFVCEMVAGPGESPGLIGKVKGAIAGTPGGGYIPKSEQIQKFVDKPIVLGKLCEQYVTELISKRDALVYIADAELYLRLARQSTPINETDMGLLRSMALRYGYTSAPDGTPIRNVDQNMLLEMLRPAMLINMGRAAPQISSAIMMGLQHMPIPGTTTMAEAETSGRRKRQRFF